MGASTLETKPGALNVKKFDLAFEVDPLFQKTSATFDEGGAKGMLLNNLSVFNGCNIAFDSSGVYHQPRDEKGDDQVTAMSLLPLCSRSAIASAPIAPLLRL